MESRSPAYCLANSIAEFQSARADHQVDEGQIDSFSCLFTTNPRDDLGCCFRDRMNGNVRLQFIDKLTPAFSAFRCVGAVDAMSEFRYGHHGDNDWRIADFGSGTDIARTSGVVSLARSAA